MASLSDVPEQIKSVLDESVAALKPAEVTLDTFNSQYLQRDASSAAAILGSAKVLRILDAPTEEVESLLFTTLKDDVRLRLEVRRCFYHLFQLFKPCGVLSLVLTGCARDSVLPAPDPIAARGRIPDSM